MSEYEQYYEACQRGMFASPDAKYCGCRGRGWFLSQLDTWHKCPAHFDGQPDPEVDDFDPDYVYEPTAEALATSEALRREAEAAAAADAALVAEGEIPF